MSIIHSFTHPGFCDPRACSSHLFEDGTVTYEHRSTGMTWTPAAQCDVQITVDVSQIADTGEYGSGGQVNATLRLRDMASVAPGCEHHLDFDVDLDPQDCRMLAAQLVVLAEQSESIRRQIARGAA